MWISIIRKRKRSYLPFKLGEDKLKTYHIHAQIGWMWMPTYGLKYHWWFCAIFGYIDPKMCFNKWIKILFTFWRKVGRCLFQFQKVNMTPSLVMKIPSLWNNNHLKASGRICSSLCREMTKWFGNMYPLDSCFLRRWSLVSLMT